MTFLRWLLGGLATVAAAGAVLSFALYVALGVELQLQRARAFRGWLYAALLLWFNVEIWRRVLLTIVHWTS